MRQPLTLGWLVILSTVLQAGTVSLYLFDEQKEIYPSCPLTDSGPNGYFLALGRGARIVEGRFGHALEPAEPLPLTIGGTSARPGSESALRFGLVPVPTPADRTVEPMTWMNALFGALLTSGEKHLRSPGFGNVTDTKLNL